MIFLYLPLVRKYLVGKPKLPKEKEAIFLVCALIEYGWLIAIKKTVIIMIVIFIVFVYLRICSFILAILKDAFQRTKITNSKKYKFGFNPYYALYFMY